ncbi:helix-turn-helix transcriptional regulator [Chitinophaga sp. YIM B06452]|uniref:helix-turn-helix domain-containing protein n=1 Tax=Chitinophaga sp. YIM B06452 TaxID=3082158 RepID=UPI0031FE7A49
MATKLDQVYDRVPEHTKLMVSKSFDISERILDILDEKGWTQKDLADKLSKKESEISRWMKGTHNFTLETIAKIEVALEQTILDTSPRRERNVIGQINVVKTIYLDPSSGGKEINATLEGFTQLFEIKRKLSF